MCREHGETSDSKDVGSLHFSRSVEGLREATEPYQHELFGFVPVDWLESGDNYALTDGENWALFERGTDGVYTGHYFFVIRGRSALKLGKEMLEYLFTNTDINVLRGLTPLHKLGARWLSRQLGFTSYGVVHTYEPCELFIMTRQEWKDHVDGRR